MKNKKYILLLVMSLLLISFTHAKSQEVKLSYQQFKVNGQSLNVVNYTINGQAYYRIRDIAGLLKNTAKRFNIEYDKEKNEVIINKDKNYINENKFVIYEDSDVAIKSKSKLRYENNMIELESYNIKGYNYYRIEDIAELLKFIMEYEISPKSIVINTNEKYSSKSGSVFYMNHFFL